MQHRRATLLLLMALAGGACSATGGQEAAISDGPDAAAASAVASEPATVAADSPELPVATTAPPTTIKPAPPTTVRSSTVTTSMTLPPGVPWPAGVPRDAEIIVVNGNDYVPVPTIPRRPAPAGVTTHGSGNMGWSKVTAFGPITVDFQVFPADLYLNQKLQLAAAVTYTGAARPVKVDWGDGTSYVGPELGRCTFPAYHSDGGWLLNSDVTHTYANPGLYTVTATFTIADCVPPPGFAGPTTAPNFNLPNGQPMPAPTYPPMGNDTVVTTSMTVQVHPVKLPVVIRINDGPG